jgi:hypothetical protein
MDDLAFDPFGCTGAVFARVLTAGRLRGDLSPLPRTQSFSVQIEKPPFFGTPLRVPETHTLSRTSAWRDDGWRKVLRAVV